MGCSSMKRMQALKKYFVQFYPDWIILLSNNKKVLKWGVLIIYLLGFWRISSFTGGGSPQETIRVLSQIRAGPLVEPSKFREPAGYLPCMKESSLWRRQVICCYNLLMYFKVKLLDNCLWRKALHTSLNTERWQQEASI